MKTQTFLRFLASILLILGSSTSFAESMYIDDTLLVPLRSGEGLSYRIVHKGVPSGTRLQVLGHNKETGYSKVLTPTGIEGYLPTRYLVSEPIARDKLDQATRELAEFKQAHAKLKEQFDALNNEHQALTKKFRETQGLLDANVQELSYIRSVSADAMSMDQRNRELGESNEQLRNQLELLQTDNDRLKEKTEANMMLVGGGLVLFGVFLTLIIPMLKPSKKNDSWA